MNFRYLNGLYQAKSSSIFEKDTYDNLRQLNKNDFINYLKNHNYGLTSNYLNIDNVLLTELLNVRKEVDQLTNSTLIGDIFYMNHDLNNIKIAYKSVKYNLPVDQIDLVSSYEINSLIEFFSNDNKSFLSDNQIEILELVNNIKADSLKEELEFIEKTIYSYYYNKVSLELPSLMIYLETLNFRTNLFNCLKLRARNNNVSYFEKLLLPQSVFPSKDWLEVFNMSDDQIVSKIELFYSGKLVEGLKSYFTSNDLNLLNNSVNSVINEIMGNLNYNHNSIGPVLYYLHLKNDEVNNLRGVYYERK